VQWSPSLLFISPASSRRRLCALAAVAGKAIRCNSKRKKAAARTVSKLEEKSWRTLESKSKKLVADLSHRDAVETAVTAVVAGILQKYQAEVQFLDPSIPPAQLDNLDRDLATVLLLALITVFKTEASKIATQLELATIDIEATANEWASKKTKQIVKDFRAKTLALLQKAKLKQNQNNAAILAAVFNPFRSIALSSTNVTAAASAGELTQIKKFKAKPPTIEVDPVTGVMTKGPMPQTRTIWRTRADGKVCSKCSPLNGTDEDVWGLKYPDGPAAHNYCRCFLTTEIS